MDPGVSKSRTAGAHMIDSIVFGHQWSTELSQSIFAEERRVRRWVGVIAALGRAQATLGIIPHAAADEISGLVDGEIDLAAVAAATRETSHSTLGLIQVMQSMLPAGMREYVYYGTTVQDITDTSMMIELAAVGSEAWVQLHQIELALIDLAAEHRSTPMLGRTHGQPGAPISFGFKVASWADEVGRSIARLADMRDRVLAVQFGGAVGALGFFGDQALGLRRAFAAEVGLPEPAVSWLTARDRIAEFATGLSIAVSSLARIANEVYSLQRREIGEVSEGSGDSVVGSITMPHKRNPESSEQIVVLARLVRSHAATLTDTMVQEHERDARGWKAEWAVFPELCHYALTAISLSKSLVDGLEVHAAAMRHNVETDPYASSEQLLRRWSPSLGKHRAQALLNEVYRTASEGDNDVAAALADVVKRDGTTSGIVVGDLTVVETGASEAMVDRVVAAAHARRKSGAPGWP